MSWFRSGRIRKDDYELWHEISTNAHVQQLARWEKSLSWSMDELAEVTSPVI